MGHIKQQQVARAASSAAAVATKGSVLESRVILFLDFVTTVLECTSLLMYYLPLNPKKTAAAT